MLQPITYSVRQAVSLLIDQSINFFPQRVATLSFISLPEVHVWSKWKKGKRTIHFHYHVYVSLTYLHCTWSKRWFLFIYIHYIHGPDSPSVGAFSIILVSILVTSAVERRLNLDKGARCFDKTLRGLQLRSVSISFWHKERILQLATSETNDDNVLVLFSPSLFMIWLGYFNRQFLYKSILPNNLVCRYVKIRLVF